MEKIGEILEKPGGKSKIENSKVFDEIKRIYQEFLPDLREKTISIRNLYLAHIVPAIPSDENISYVNFMNWHKSQAKKNDEVVVGKSLMEREIQKRTDQIEIRQDITSLMKTFVQGLKDLANDPESLKASGINIKDLYKIIREEEDRNKMIDLKERSENRADAQFAFMVALARAGEVTDADIEFLEENVKNELMDLKISHGVYKLPTANQMAEVPVAAEALASVANEGNS